MKLIDWYWFKDKDLWLTSEPDVHGNYTDSSPKALFLIALDWFTTQEKPYVTIKQEPKDYYETFHIRLYLTYYQLCVTVRLGKMPYRTKEEYLQWRNK